MKKYVVKGNGEHLYYLYEDNTIFAQKEDDRDLKLIGLFVIKEEKTDEEILQIITYNLKDLEGLFTIEHMTYGEVMDIFKD